MDEMTKQVVGQILGFVAMALSVLTYQMNTHKKMMVMQINCAAFFVAHYLFIGAVAGAVVNVIAVIRNMIFYHRDKKVFSGNGWVLSFAALMALGGALSWQQDGWICLLASVGMVFNTLSLSCTNPQTVRLIMAFASPLMLVYNILTHSIPGAANETFSEISTITALIRTSRKEKKAKE